MYLSPKPNTRLLLCSRKNDSVLALQSAVFRDSGYAVIPAASNEEIRKHIDNADFDVIILNHTLSFSDRTALARKAKMRNAANGVLVLHHSGSLGNPHVDLAVDSRAGGEAMLCALHRVEAMLHARSHYRSDSAGKYFVVADAKRNYIFVSDAVCELLGYERAVLLERRIDDIVLGSTPLTEPLFEQLVSAGAQDGTITLRHRSGQPIAVRYWSKVEPDGCMVAHWKPIDNISADKTPGSLH